MYFSSCKSQYYNLKTLHGTREEFELSRLDWTKYTIKFFILNKHSIPIWRRTNILPNFLIIIQIIILYLFYAVLVGISLLFRELNRSVRTENENYYNIKYAPALMLHRVYIYCNACEQHTRVRSSEKWISNNIHIII